MTAVHLDTDLVPQTSPVSLHFHLVTTLNISAVQARRLANRHIVSELGTGLAARTPELVIAGEQIKWRLPVVLSLPSLGELGEVGAVEIDAQTGVLLTSAEAQEKIIQHANRLYHGATLPSKPMIKIIG